MKRTTWSDSDGAGALGGQEPAAAALGTTVSDHTALYGGASWVSAYGTVEAKAQPAFVTYSFPTAMAAHAKEALPAPAGTWRPFSTTEKALARAALDQWAKASGLVFLEVGGARGDIQFNWIDFAKTSSPSASGFAYYPAGQTAWGTKDPEAFHPLSGDVFLNTKARSSGLATNLSKSFVLMHEIGHALGFKHPFEANSFNNRTLRSTLDNHSQTVMSYSGLLVEKLGPLDLAAARAVYGGPASDGSHLASWRWDARSETLTQTGKSGAETIRGTSVRDRINGGAGNDVISGFAGADHLRGSYGVDRIYGGQGDDTLLPGRGGGVVSGGTGTDTLDLSDLGRAAVVDLQSGRIQAGAEITKLSGIEIVVGSSAADRLIGAWTHDRLSGGAGADVLIGGLGNDRLDGGSGVDTADYSQASFRVTVNLGRSGSQGTGLGLDTLISIEKVIGGIADDGLTAGTVSATLLGGSGNDRLTGGAGNDALEGGLGDDILIGQAGRNTMRGGAGNDRYDVSRATDAVIESRGAGFDTIFTSVSFSLAPGAEVEVLRPSTALTTSALQLTGNGFANTVWGNGGSNVLRGMGGDDSLSGNDGNDTLSGGAGTDEMRGGGGADAFLFDEALDRAGVDVVLDFFAGEDFIRLELDVFDGLGGIGTLAAALFALGEAATDDATRVLYDAPTGRLLYDADGSGSAEAIHFATLSKNLALTAPSLLVV